MFKAGHEPGLTIILVYSAQGQVFHCTNSGSNVAVLLKGSPSTANSRTSVEVLVGMNRCSTFSLLSALQIVGVLNMCRVLEENNSYLSKELGAPQDTTHRQLKTLAKTFRICRSNELAPQQAKRRVDICHQLIGNPIDDRFIRKVVTWWKMGLLLLSWHLKTVPRSHQHAKVLLNLSTGLDFHLNNFTFFNLIENDTESSKYYARMHMAVARGLRLPAGQLAGHQTDAASEHSTLISVYFPSRWSCALTYICKAESLAFTDCDYF